MRGIATAVLSLALLATSAPAQEPATGGFLFTYRLHPGQTAEFEAGYRSHLEWHRERGDSLTWLGWTVLAGSRPGLSMACSASPTRRWTRGWTRPAMPRTWRRT